MTASAQPTSPPHSSTSLERGVVWSLVIIVAATIALVALLTPNLIPFQPITVAMVMDVVTPLLLIALFIERGLEVFLTSWRGGAAKRYEEAEDQPALREHKVITQRIAFLAAASLGIIVSALGVRALQPLLYPDLFPGADGFQLHERGFIAADVLLTGVVLGGGAEALHKLVSVFTNFMDTTARKAKPNGG